MGLPLTFLLFVLHILTDFSQFLTHGQAQRNGFYQAVGLLCMGHRDIRQINMQDSNFLQQAHDLGARTSMGHVRGCAYHWQQSVNRIVDTCFASHEVEAIQAFLTLVDQMQNSQTVEEFHLRVFQLETSLCGDRAHLKHWLRFWTELEVGTLITSYIWVSFRLECTMFVSRSGSGPSPVHGPSTYHLSVRYNPFSYIHFANTVFI